MARGRSDVTPPVPIHVHEGHVVIYQLVKRQVVILRLTGGGQDWRAILAAAES